MFKSYFDVQRSRGLESVMVGTRQQTAWHGTEAVAKDLHLIQLMSRGS